jgi:hypothetical protein
MATHIDSGREFLLWKAVVSHGQVLVRSVKSDTEPTRIDVLFKPVRAMKLPTKFEGLRVRDAEADETERIEAEVGTLEADEQAFVVESDGFDGYVVAALVSTHEDEKEYDEPSALFAD